MAIKGGDANLKGEMEAARDKFFAECDADGDGRLNAQEAEAYHAKDRAWRIERYGGDGDDITQEEGEAWYAAMNAMSEGEGYTMEDMIRMEFVFETIAGE